MNASKYVTTKEELAALTHLIEDSVSYFCGEHLVSGEFAWTVIECLAVAKQREFLGQID